jgi:hypothetical protein
MYTLHKYSGDFSPIVILHLEFANAQLGYLYTRSVKRGGGGGRMAQYKAVGHEDFCKAMFSL